MSASPTPDERSFPQRLLTTSLGDLLRGRVNGALDSRHVVATADLPVALKTAIRRVVNRASWRLASRTDLARRLVIDCEAQLADGYDVQKLRESLTPPRSDRRWRRRPKPDALLTLTLPAALQTLVTTVVRKTRLSRQEKLNVCRELCEHFRDGLAAGETPDELARTFGDIAPAARLIRRAKIRNRSWQRQLVGYSVRAAQIAVAAGVLFWCFLAVRYFGTEPNIARNYLAEMDAAFVGIPAEESAWPLYREALMDLTASPDRSSIWDETGLLHDDVRQFVVDNQRAVTLSRKAAGRSRMGFSYQDRDNGEWLLARGHMDGEAIERFFTPDGPVVEAMLPHIQQMRLLGRLLADNAWVAAERSDTETVTADLSSMFTMAKHTRDNHAFIVTELVSLAIFNMAAEHTGRLLEQYPDLLSDEQLARLADRFDESLDGGRNALNFDGERAMLADTMQRIYSDDGGGDGYITRQGVEFLNDWGPRNQSELWKHSSTTALAVATMAEPLYASRIASRREISDVVDEIFAVATAESRRPRWLRQSIYDHPDFAEKLNHGGSDPHWLPTYVLMPAFDALMTVADHAKQNREAALTVIALNRYRGQHGAWPDSLVALVPDFLPAEPIDHANGESLRYRLVDNQPLLYSVGGNGTDDGGIRSSNFHKHNPLYGSTDGDWILWPPADLVVD